MKKIVAIFLVLFLLGGIFAGYVLYNRPYLAERVKETIYYTLFYTPHKKASAYENWNKLEESLESDVDYFGTKIISANDKVLATYEPIYTIMLDSKYIKLCETENQCAIVDLVQSILPHTYSKRYLFQKSHNNKYTFLAQNVDKKTAMDLAWLNSVVKPYTDGEMPLKPILVMYDGVKRVYPYGELLEPVMGFTKEVIIGGTKRRKGMIGLEALALNDDILKEFAYCRSRGIETFLGCNDTLQTTIDLEDQKNLQKNVDEYKAQYDAKEVMGIEIDLYTGEIIALASSQRYDPNHITKEDIPKFSTHFNKYLFRSKTLMYPFIASVESLEGKKIDKLSALTILKYLKKFHLFEPSSELPNERQMNIEKFLQDKNFSVEDIKLNFLQMIKLYSMFFKTGLESYKPQKMEGIITPKILKNTKRELIPILDGKKTEQIYWDMYYKFKDPAARNVLLEFKDKNVSGTLIFWPVYDSQRIMLAYLVVRKGIIGEARYKNIRIYPVTSFDEEDYGGNGVCPERAASSDVILSLQYPQIAGLKNKKIQKKINNLLRKYSGVDNIEKYTSYTINYKIINLDSDHLSISFYTNAMACDAPHNYTSFNSVNISLKTGKVLTLNDLFEKKFIDTLQDKIFDQLKMNYQYEFTKEWIKPKTFAFDDKQIYFYYSMGEIAANYMGDMSVKISYTKKDLK